LGLLCGFKLYVARRGRKTKLLLPIIWNRIATQRAASSTICGIAVAAVAASGDRRGEYNKRITSDLLFSTEFRAPHHHHVVGVVVVIILSPRDRSLSDAI
jgi:hypothetical protein